MYALNIWVYLRKLIKKNMMLQAHCDFDLEWVHQTAETSPFRKDHLYNNQCNN